MAPAPGYEHTALRGITIKNMILTVVCTATMVASVMTTYFELKESIRESNTSLSVTIAEMKYNEEKQNSLYEIRLKTVEAELQVVQQQVAQLQQNKK